MKVFTIAPLTCMFCRKKACYEELPICHFCVHKLQQMLNARCKTCGKRPQSCECSDNQKVRFLFFYGGYYSRRLMYFVKTNIDDRVMDFLAELLVNSCGIKPDSFDGVTYVPRLKKNIRYHGYDQSKELAKSISKLFGIPLVTTLTRVGGRDQKLLSYSQRLKNMKNRFRPVNIPEQRFKKLLLVDDIFTTGATMSACESLVREHFAKSVVTLVLAKTNFADNGFRS